MPLPSSSSLKLSNGAVSRLAADITSSETTITLIPGEGSLFPSLEAGRHFPATIIKEDGSVEIVKVTARAIDVLTVVRAQEGTSAKSFLAGDRFELRLTAGALMQEIERINTDINTNVPFGGIIMFNGTNPGTGWAICNGQTVARSDGTGNVTTPDLRDRFIVGSGTTYALGDTGGANTVALTEAQMPAHNHSGSTGNQSNDHSHSGTTGGHSNDHAHYFVTNANGEHSHTTTLNLDRATTSAGNAVYGDESYYGQSSPSTSSAGNHQHDGWTSGVNSNHTHNFATGGVSAGHTHSFTTGSTGGGQAHENRPPYYALAFIMRV